MFEVPGGNVNLNDLSVFTRCYKFGPWVSTFFALKCLKYKNVLQFCHKTHLFRHFSESISFFEHIWPNIEWIDHQCGNMILWWDFDTWARLRSMVISREANHDIIFDHDGHPGPYLYLTSPFLENDEFATYSGKFMMTEVHPHRYIDAKTDAHWLGLQFVRILFFIYSFDRARNFDQYSEYCWSQQFWPHFLLEKSTTWKMWSKAQVFLTAMQTNFLIKS